MSRGCIPGLEEGYGAMGLGRVGSDTPTTLEDSMHDNLLPRHNLRAQCRYSIT